jgi:DNA uptake protein ComE-like DNA-binding protein
MRASREEAFPMSLAKKGLWLLSVSLFLGALLSVSPGVASAKGKDKPAKVDLNTASQKELEDLPGVGQAIAAKIVAGRPYSKVGDLEKAGVAKSTIDKIRKLVTVSKAASRSESKSDSKSAKTTERENRAPPAPASQPESSSKEASVAAAGPKIDLNTASAKELEALPAVGSATAKKIIAGRPYSSVGDLVRAGVSMSTITKIRSRVTVGAAAAGSKPAPVAKAAPAGAPASAAAPAPTSPPVPAAKPASAAAPSAEKPAQPPPAKGMVWVNTATKVYHYEGDRWYGNTKEGKYMTEQEAIQAGYRASKEGHKKQ